MCLENEAFRVYIYGDSYVSINDQSLPLYLRRCILLATPSAILSSLTNHSTLQAYQTQQ